MPRVCELTGKRPVTGNNVSHSNRRTKRRFYPNLQKKKFFIPEINKWITIKLSTSALRTINKKGVYRYLKELEKEGIFILDRASVRKIKETTAVPESVIQETQIADQPASVEEQPQTDQPATDVKQPPTDQQTTDEKQPPTDQPASKEPELPAE